jgi:hypothetical protein
LTANAAANRLRVFQAERYRGGVWEGLATMYIARQYHSTALLLPDGTVLLAGGEGHGTVVPYETFKPPYLFAVHPRPEWLLPDQLEDIAHGGTYQAGYQIGVGGAITKVVLIRAGSVTHHFDQDQRYYEMPATVDELQSLVSFTVTDDKDELPPGYYMAFLVSDQSVPSHARWLRVTP